MFPGDEGSGKWRKFKSLRWKRARARARARPSRRALRGLIPGVVYGGKGEPENVAVDGRTLERHIEAGHFLTTLFMLELGGKKTRVIPREVQLDPVSDRPVHVDFMRLAEGATVRLDIPVHFNGQESSPGLKKGGVLNIVRHDDRPDLPGREDSQHDRSGCLRAGHQ